MIVMGDAVTGGVGAGFVFSILYLNVLAQLVFFLPFSFYLATLLTLGRLYSDSEMTALAACGVGYRQLIKAVLMVGTLIAAVMFVLSLVVSPWAVSESHRQEELSKQQSDVQAFKAGEFKASQNGKNVIYIEAINGQTSRLHNVFAHGVSNEQSYTIYASSGYQLRDRETGLQYIVLENGRRYSGIVGTADYQVIEFQRYKLRLGNDKEIGPQWSLLGRTTASLYASGKPREWAELHWRLSLPVATILLGLIAIPLSRTNPRQGRYSKLFVAILIFAAYVNLLGMGQVWLENGTVPVSVGLWWVHLLLLC